MQRLGVDVSQGPTLVELIAAQGERSKTLREMAEKSLYFYQDIIYDDKAVAKHITPEQQPMLTLVREQLAMLSVWEKEEIHKAVSHSVEILGVKFGKLAQPIRVAVTGNTISPPIDVTLMLLGKEKVLSRLDRALVLIESLNK